MFMEEIKYKEWYERNRIKIHTTEIDLIVALAKTDLDEFIQGDYSLMKYNDCYSKTHFLFRFNNGYGASIICGNGSIGFEDAKYEMALIRWYPKFADEFYYQLVYDKNRFKDVVGYLSPNDVVDLLKYIKRKHKRK